MAEQCSTAETRDDRSVRPATAMALGRVGPLTPDEAGELLTLQRAAYVSEAQIYGDPTLPPLVETLEAVQAALRDPQTLILGIRSERGRLVAAGRVTDLGGSRAYIARLAVAPDMQGSGLGTRLVHELEQQAPGAPTRLELYTGSLSASNLRLYEHLGYREFHRNPTPAGYTEVHLAKDTPRSR